MHHLTLYRFLVRCKEVNEDLTHAISGTKIAAGGSVEFSDTQIVHKFAV